MKILITGAAGFIGFHTSLKLLSKNCIVIGIDNLNDYYDINLKKKRISILKKYKNFRFFKIDLLNLKRLSKLFKDNEFTIVINLAAQAGVQFSITNPYKYIESNIIGFFNILECCRKFKTKILLYASSSSVYGDNSTLPFSESDKTLKPLSFYGATKISNEAMAYSYSNLYGLKTIGLRFFTVFGPWGRPDMAPMKFIQAILNNKPIKLFNKGKHLRDFTYIDDITLAIFKLIKKKTTKENIHFKIFNIGNNKPIKLLNFVKFIENKIGKKAKKILLPIQKGDVKNTHANISKIKKYINFTPKVTVENGVSKLVDWYLDYYC